HPQTVIADRGHPLRAITAAQQPAGPPGRPTPDHLFRQARPFFDSQFFATVSGLGFASPAASAFSAVSPSVVSFAETAFRVCLTVSFTFALFTSGTTFCAAKLL